jgi:hypothetical protein
MNKDIKSDFFLDCNNALINFAMTGRHNRYRGQCTPVPVLVSIAGHLVYSFISTETISLRSLMYKSTMDRGYVL